MPLGTPNFHQMIMVTQGGKCKYQNINSKFKTQTQTQNQSEATMPLGTPLSPKVNVEPSNNTQTPKSKTPTPQTINQSQAIMQLGTPNFNNIYL